MKAVLYLLFAFTIGLWTGCTPAPESEHPLGEHDHAHEDAVTVTVWSDDLEAFVEFSSLIAGETGHVLIHLTTLDNFRPLPQEANVRLLFQPEHGGSPVEETAQAIRPGIFEAEITFPGTATGSYSLEISGAGTDAHIHLGMFHIGTGHHPGHILDQGEAEHPAVTDHKHEDTDHQSDADHNQPDQAGDQLADKLHNVNEDASGITFLKEQQWSMRFDTKPVSTGTLPHGLSVFGKVQARSGHDIILTAPVDGIVTASTWPTGGMFTGENQVLFRLVPQVSDTVSLTSLRARMDELDAAHQLATERLKRLERLLETGTVSRWEVEEARSGRQTLGNQLEAARSDLETARSLRRQSPGNVEDLPIRSPFEGQIVHVRVTPGQYVTAGTELIHVVQERPIQLELGIPVQQTPLINRPVKGLYLRSFVDDDRLYVAPDDFRVVAKTPGVDPDTGKVSLYLEVNRSLSRFPLNAIVEAELLMEGGERGIVIPTRSLVDDAGNDVVYVQLGGELFRRTPVRVLQRSGNTVLVTGLSVGDRVVTLGGPTLRRAEMVGSGSFNDHGHSH